ncbi:replication factor A protein 1 [Tanacetum coccineum]
MTKRVYVSAYIGVQGVVPKLNLERWHKEDRSLGDQGCDKDLTFILDANVVGVDLVNDWKFVQCTECFGKATWNKDHYFCEKSVIVVYKLVLKVGNGCHVMDCVFFNQYARNLLGVSVDDLISKALTLGAVITIVKYFGDHPYYIHHIDIIHVAPKLNGADVNGNHVGQSDIMRRSPNDADLNGKQLCHSDILHVSRSLNVADLNGQQLFHSDILPILETTNVGSFYGQQMQCGITSISPITKFNVVPRLSMQRDIVSEAILANVMDAVDQHMQDDIIPVSSVSNDVDQDIVHDTSHVVLKPNDSEEVPCHKDKSDCILIKDFVNNSAGSLTDLSEVTDDQGGVVVVKSVLNENIYVVASKNDSIDGVVDKSIIDVDNAQAKNIDIVSEGKDEVGSNDILNEVADEVVSDDKVYEAAANDEYMDVDEVVYDDKVSEAAANDEDTDVADVGHESKIVVSGHSYSDVDEELE